MTTDQLESFIQVAEHLNFARAAEVLQISQSAVSRQIHALEDELGSKLLYRTTRTVTLTPAGITFLEDAHYIMVRLKNATRKLQLHQASNIQILTIGCSSEEHLDFLCSILKKCRKEIPELYPFLRVIPHRSLLNLFYQGDLDLLLGFQDDIPQKEDITYKELFRLPLCALVPSDHALAKKEILNCEELYTENIVICHSYAVPSKAEALQNEIAQHILPENSYNCDNLHVLLTLIKAGYGCSVLPQNIHYSNEEITQIPLKDSEMLSYGVFYKKENSSLLLKHFLSLCSWLYRIDSRLENV